jgi:hypothetical protein
MSKLRLPLTRIRTGLWWPVRLVIVLVTTLGILSYAGLVVTERTLDPSQIIRGPGQLWVTVAVDTPLTTLGLFASRCDSISGNVIVDPSSEAVLTEDGRRLGPAHAIDDRLHADGAGVYSFRCLDDAGGRALGFSTSDNSDPRANGRSYRLSTPVRMVPELFLGPFMLLVVWGLRRLLATIAAANPRARIADGDRLTWGELAVVALAGLAFSMAWAIGSGQDRNWDQRNYHVYASFAWLHDRIGLDVEPGQVQTWSNPFPHIPYYLAIMHLPPMAAGALMGALASLNFVLIYLIGWRLIRGGSRATRHALVLPAAIIGFTAATPLSELGTTFIDNTSCLPLLAGLLLALHSFDLDDRDRRLPLISLGIGILVGLAVGLKLTHSLFLPGLAIGLLLCRRLPVTLLRIAPAGLLGIGIGFLAGDGPPAWVLWQHYGNPFFPYFNDLFKSPYYPPVPFAAATFVPQSWGEALSIPVLWAFLYDHGFTHPGPHCLTVWGRDWFCVARLTSEVPFRDPRGLLLEIGLGVAAITVLLRAFVTWPRLAQWRWLAGAEDRNRLVLMVFFLTGFAAWMAFFGYQRYFVTIDLLSGLAMALVILAILPRPRHRVAALTLAALLAVTWTRPSDWERVAYGRSWFGLDVPPPLMAPNTVFVMVNGRAASYLVPFFPPSDRFVRLTGNIVLDPEVGLGRQAERLLADHTGPIMVVGVSPTVLEVNERTFYDLDLETLKRFRLDTDFSRCLTFTSRGETLQLDRFIACPAQRRP